MEELQNLVDSIPSTTTQNFGSSKSYSHPQTSGYSIDTRPSVPTQMEFGASRKQQVAPNWVWILMGLLILAVLGLVVGLYFNKNECVCIISEEEQFENKRISAKPIMNPLIGQGSAQMPAEPRRGSKPVGNSTFPSKNASLQQPYASPPFAMHN